MDTKDIKWGGTKRALFFSFLVLSTLVSKAGFTDKVKNTISKEFNSFEGIYIMGGLIAAGLLIYVISNHFVKEKEDKNPNLGAQHHHHHHHRHHHRPHKVVKKTS